MTQLHIEVARNILQTSGKLDLLCLNTNSDNPLPSLVSDWTLGSSQPAPLWHPGLYNAAANRLQLLIPTNDTGMLDVAGVLVDKIRFVSDIIYIDPENTSKTKETIRDLMSLVYDTFDILLPRQPETDEDFAAWWSVLTLDPNPRNLDVFWRTVIGNTAIFDEKEREGFSSAPAPGEYREMFEMLLYASEDGFEDESVSRLRCRRRRRRLSQVITSVQLKAPRLRTKNFSQVPADFKSNLPLAERRRQYIRPLLTALVKLHGHVFFITEHGYMGIGAMGVKKGDLVAVPLGCDMLVVLLERDTGQPLLRRTYSFP